MDKDKLSELLKGFRLSKIFHERTKLIESKNAISYDDLIKKHFKSYPRFEKIKLEKKIKKSKTSFEDVIRKRESIRDFSGRSISKEELSKMLFLSAGILGLKNPKSTEIKYSLEYPFTFKKIDVKAVKDPWDTSTRSYPSAGGRYPLEIYLIVFESEDIDSGIYHYNVKDHNLELIKRGNFRDLTIELLNGQELVKKASLVMLISAVFGRTQNKYGERGYRYIFLDAGHLGQNIYLVIASMNLGCCAIGGFKDDDVNELLRLDSNEESVIYAFCIGKLISKK
jgi:SagB-type dehydrogenase family enzyme